MTGPRSSQTRRALEAHLASATLRALRDAHGELNRSFFGGALSTPAFVLGSSSQQLGSWDPALHSIEVSESLLLDRGWGAAIEVLKHEMAHQFVHQAGLGTGEPPHGPAFRRVCEERGIDHRAAGDPSAPGADHPVLGRIRKLLSLAQSPNEHEAQSAARVAQRLMLRHNIDQLSAERDDGYAYRQLGRTTGRTSEAERILGTILQDHYFVDVIWVFGFRPHDAKYGRVMEVCGRHENVELASYVYDFLTRTAERLWREHKRAEGIRRNRDRRAYLAGVMSGFREQLDEQKEEQIGSGLVWLGDPGLARYFERRHRSVSSRTYYERVGDAAREHGRSAGQKVVLHHGIESRSRTRAPRQLGSGPTSPAAR